MYLSPPIAILAILAVGVGGVTWLAPPPREPAWVAVHISTTTYDKLSLWAKEHPGGGGQPLTVAQTIDKLAAEVVKDASREKK